MAGQTITEKINESVADLRDKASSIQNVEDLESILNVVKELKMTLETAISELRRVFDSEEWRNRPQRKNSTELQRRSNSISNPIFELADRFTQGLENTLKKYQLLAMELNEVDSALEYLLPVYRMGMEIFSEHEEIIQTIKDACEDLGSQFEEVSG